jgi:ubiquinone/menaquinone biosynthesis C-methylase UbiE
MALVDERARIAAYYELRADSKVVRRYSHFDRGHLYHVQRLERDLLDALARHGFADLHPRWILDVGCGDGALLRRLVAYGANPARMSGVDILPQRVDRARRIDPCLDIRCLDARELPFPDARFDIVFQMTVFSLIFDDAVQRAVASEMTRVLKPGGAVISYDFRIARDPRHTRPIRRDDLAALFPDLEVDARRVTLAPPIARALAGRSWVLCELLETIPALRTHELVVLRKP